MAMLAARRCHRRYAPRTFAMIGLGLVLLGHLALVVWICWWAGAEERATHRQALRERDRR